MSENLPRVAVIGRPNVGKSTLFNRIEGKRTAIVHDRPGVTRDRLDRNVSWAGYDFILVDTGGFDLDSGDVQVKVITRMALRGVKEAAVVIFVVDAAAGPTPQDADVARLLRREGKRVFVAANKVDTQAREGLAAAFNELGFDEVYPISAEHGLGVAELLDAVVAALPREAAPEAGERIPNIAVVGRPNVGKSTLINRFLGDERLVTDDAPGTTRDSIDTRLNFEGREYVLIDTAGMRRKGKVDDPVERFSAMRSEDSIYRADVCLLLIDAREMVTDQDMKIAGLIDKAGRGCIVLVNKWDLMEGMDRGPAEKLVLEKLPFVRWAPVVFISARTGFGAHKVLPLVDEVWAEYNREISTPDLTTFLYGATRASRPATFHGKTVTFGYMTQSRAKPPTFTILVNDPARVHFTYRRYLLNRLREEFGFKGVPVKLRFRARET